MEAEANNKCTILDYLNEDCWHAVLRYVPVRDILLSERVNRRWQRAVLAYLEGTRFSFWGRREDKDNSPSNASCWPLSISMYESFEKWIAKLGSRVLATYCKNQEHLKIIRENCPNLEALTLINFTEVKTIANKNKFIYNFNKDFKCLKRLSFDTCIISDQCVSLFVAHKTLEELAFCYCFDLTGQCLNSANLSNIKSLTFERCLNLETPHILSSTNQLCELRKLGLLGVPNEILKEIQLVLDRMPKLEHLEIYTRGRANLYLENYEPLCRLSDLKQLSTDLKVTDHTVEAIIRCCKNLHTLELENCEALSLRGFKAIGQNAGERLKELVIVSFYCLKDNDLVNCIGCCPKLTLLLVGGLCQITPALPALVSVVRHKVSPGNVLRLNLCNSHLTDPDYPNSIHYQQMQEEYEDLIVVYEHE